MKFLTYIGFSKLDSLPSTLPLFPLPPEVGRTFLILELSAIVSNYANEGKRVVCFFFLNNPPVFYVLFWNL